MKLTWVVATAALASAPLVATAQSSVGDLNEFPRFDRSLALSLQSRILARRVVD